MLTLAFSAAGILRAGLLDEATGNHAPALLAKAVGDSASARVHVWRSAKDGKLEKEVVRVDDREWIAAFADLVCKSQRTNEEPGQFSSSPPVEFVYKSGAGPRIYPRGDRMIVEFGGLSGVYSLLTDDAKKLSSMLQRENG